MTRAAYAVIDLQALRHNLQKARQAAPSSRVMAVIKADAYGHGMLTVAQALEQADAFAVAFVNEAVPLREAGIHCPIVALQGVRNPQELLSAEHHRIDLVLHHRDQLKLLQTTDSKDILRIWLKVDTGMHRLGLSPSELKNVYHTVIRLAAIKGRPALMTHLACADDRADTYTQQQLERFNAAISGLPGERSIANSAAILGFPQTHADWIRPGIMLYGASPFIDESASSLDLRPVMTLKAPLIAIKQQIQGDAIGYGSSFVCPEDMPIGIAAVGYG
ncbi:MAG: alanine racemase, partial [Pseudomonadota bacterium]